ncbi:MAG TPA: AraC family transcriptional regulator [Sphingobium sp.]
MKLPLSPDSDALTEVLGELRIEGVRHGRSHVTGRWAYSLPAQPFAVFHFVVRNSCWLRLPSGTWSPLREGDAVVLPHGAEHIIAVAPDVGEGPFPPWPCRPVDQTSLDREFSGAGDGTVIFYSAMRFSIGTFHPVLRMMPELLHVDELIRKERSITALLDSLGSELVAGRIGSAGIASRLADVIAAQVIRSWVESANADTFGWLAALRDPQIGQALAAIHAAPNKSWSVAALARLAGISRSGFAAKFAAMVQETPAQYVARLRMHQASGLLRRDGIRIGEVAERLGYESDATFSRAFKRVTGRTPTEAKNDRGETAAASG